MAPEMIVILVSLVGGSAVYAAFYGGYKAMKDKLDRVTDSLKKDNLKLAKELDRTNLKVRTYKVELAKANEALEALKLACFEANAENVLIKK